MKHGGGGTQPLFRRTTSAWNTPSLKAAPYTDPGRDRAMSDEIGQDGIGQVSAGLWQQMRRRWLPPAVQPQRRQRQPWQETGLAALTEPFVPNAPLVLACLR